MVSQIPNPEPRNFQNGEHITDTYITEIDTNELESLSHNIIDISVFILRKISIFVAGKSR